MELQGRKVSLPSGAEIYIKSATYLDTEAFLGAFLEAIAGFPLSNQDGSPNEELIKTFSEIAVSKAFTNQKLNGTMWKCLSYCLYVKKSGSAPEKVTPQLFDSAGDRGDLAEIFYECAAENFTPFMKGLWNVSKRLASQVRVTLK